MNKFLTVFIIFLVCVSCTKETSIDYAIFSGKISDTKIDTLTLIGGDLNKEMIVSEKGVFRDTIQLDSAGYFNFNLKEWAIELYLQPGSNIDLTVDFEDNTPLVTYTGKGANENNFLIKKYANRKVIQDKADYYRGLDAIQTKDKIQEIKNVVLDLLKTEKNLDANFVLSETMHNTYYYLDQLYIYSYSKPKAETPKGYYNGAEDIDFYDTRLYNQSQDYKSLVQNFLKREKEMNSVETEDFIDGYMNFAKNIPVGVIRDDFLSKQILFQFSPRNEKYYTDLYSVLMTSTDKESKEYYTETYEVLKKLKKGNPSTEFDYENYAGGTTSLNDLKGKYVYMDLWATWCGPCYREFPHLKKMEHEYRNKNIVFVSISIDEQKDNDKWRKTVEKEELTGTQLIVDYANSDSRFLDDYFVRGVPRFILLDPKGNIVSAEAPYPSWPQLKELFEELKI